MVGSKPIITVIGSINMDLVIQCQRIPLPGETILADSAAEFCGGKGANQAVAASLAGGEVNFVGRVGDDAFQARLLANLSDHGVGVDHVDASESCNSGLAVISVEASGQNSITVVPGANGQLSVSDVERARALIESSDLLMLQLEVPINVALAGMEIARQSSVRVMLDPAPAPQQWPDRLLQVDMICPNETEAEKLTGLPVRTEQETESAARKLCAMGASNVAITMGDRGTMLRTGGQSQFIASFPVKAVDTTGAGDAFAGALAVHWCQHNDLARAVSFANAAGALAASKPGAQPSMATREQIESLWRTR